MAGAAVVALVAIGFLAAGSVTSGFDTSQPMQNGVWYELNADSGKASWLSFGEKPNDPWTAQFFPGAIEPVDLSRSVRVYSRKPKTAERLQGPGAGRFPAGATTESYL